MNILEGIAKIVKSILFISSKLFSCKFQFLHGMIEESAFYHCGHNRLHNAFPNGKMEIFCFGEYDLLTYLTWIVRC